MSSHGQKTDGLQPVYSTVAPVHTTRAMIDAQLEEIDREERVEKDNSKLKGVNSKITTVDMESIKEFDITSMERNSVILVVASRRSGKTHITQHILEQYHKKKPFDAVFLFSKTNSGFEKSIPQTYRFKTLDMLQNIVDTQIKVKKHNKKAKKKDMVTSNIAIVLDDYVGSGGLTAEMRKNPILNKLAVNGRHLDFGGRSNVMVFMLSQIYTGISPQIRLNADYVFTTKLSAKKERENIIQGFLSLESGRQGLANSYGVFDNIVNEKDFQFIVINTTAQNKTKFSDYVFKLVAPPKLEDTRLVGDSDDWKHNNLDIYF